MEYSSLIFLCFLSEQGIDTMDTLLLLSEQEIKELVPKIGDRVKLKSQIQKRRESSELLVGSFYLYIH